MHVVWEGPFQTLESLSRVNRNVVLAAEKIGLRVSRWENRDAYQGPVPDFYVRHKYPPDFSHTKAPLIWFQGTEIGSFPKAWKDSSNHMMMYWTYSRYCAEQAMAAGIPPTQVEILPLGLDPDCFRPKAPTRHLLTQKKFRFLFVGGILFRKGVDLLLEAFVETFRADDDVALILKGSYYSDKWISQKILGYLGNSEIPEIIYLEDSFSDVELASLYNECHCYVQPYRAEGFGLPMLEAMGCGLPVILTRAGSALDFATSSNSIQIPARAHFFKAEDRVNWGMTDTPFFYQPDKDSLKQALRFVYEHSREVRKLGLCASNAIRQNWTHDRSALWLKEKLFEYVDNPPPKSDPQHRPTSQMVEAQNALFPGHLSDFQDSLTQLKKNFAGDAEQFGA